MNEQERLSVFAKIETYGCTAALVGVLIVFLAICAGLAVVLYRMVTGL